MAKQVSDSSSMELSHYATVLRRRWKYVVACLALGVAAAAVAVLTLPSSSTSTTSVNVNVIAANSFNTARPASDLIDASTEQSMVRSTKVMSDVADELGSGWTKSSVRSSTEATMLPDSTVLRIEFTTRSAWTAAEGASLVAEQYLAYRTAAAEERLALASDRLVTRRNTLNKQLATVNTQIAEAVPGSGDELAGEMERQRIAEELSSVTNQLSELQSINTSGGQVVTEADPAQVATSPNRFLILASGTLGGLLLGLVVAFVANIADRRVRDEYDVVGAGGVTVLARLVGEQPELPATGHDIDQVRALRERMMSAVEARRPVLGVVEIATTDSLPSDLAANLAVSLSDSGLTTDLVLADYPPAALAAAVDALGVREITPLGRARRFRGGVSEGLTVVVPHGQGTRLSTSDLLAELVADDVRVAECTVVALAPGAGAAVRLTAGRCSHQLVFGVHETAASIDDLAEVSADLRAVWAVVLGSVLLSRQRELGGDTDEAPVVVESAPAASTNTAKTANTAAEAGSDVASDVASDVDSEVASERGRIAGEASRKGRLRAGNTAVVEAAPGDVPAVTHVVPPVIQPVIQSVAEPVIPPVEDESLDEAALDEPDVDEPHLNEAAEDESVEDDSTEDDSAEEDSTEEPAEDELTEDPSEGQEPGSLPWAFSR